MDSDEIRTQLQQVDRAAAAPYIDYPPTPRWYPPAAGLWAGAAVLVWQLDGPGFTAAVVSLLALEILFIHWMTKRHGALPIPGQGTPPPEIARQYRGFFACVAGTAMVVGLLWWLVGPAVAAVSAVLVVTGGLVAYERTYADAAARVRARLS